MDLSQQELPLTAYFTRVSQEGRSRSTTYKKRKKKEVEEKLADDSHSVARCSKRRKSDVQYSTASPPGCSADQSESRKTILQLPTPATSTRKRKRNGHLEVPAKTRAAATGTVLSSVEQSAIPQNEEDLSQLQFGPTPSKLPQVSRNVAVPLATSSTDRRRIKSTGIGLHPGPQHSNRGETGVDCFPLARSECRLPSNPTPASPRPLDSEVPRALLPHVQHSARPTAGRPSPPVDLDCPDPFSAREKNSGSVRRDGAFASPKQCSVQSKTLDNQPSDGHALPMIPIPSSQSQYLLHLDATPKRRRYSRHIETVISSQTQEEQELTLSTPRRPTVIVDLPVGVSPGKHTHGNALIPLSCNKQINQHVYALGSTPLGSPNNSPVCPSRSVVATKNALDELSHKSSSPSRRKKLTSHHSPSRKAKTAMRSRHNSIENIPPAHIEESLTESESESDILHMRMKDRLSMLGPPSLGMNQIPRHVSVALDACPPVHRGLVEDNLHGAEDDSVTEAESDTEILHCVAEIGKKRFRDHRSQVAKEHTPPPPVISPLVSPARSRIATVPSITGSAQFCTQEDPSTLERPQILSESLPSVVRDFLRMFPGDVDESYPADFPESLRV